MADENVQYLSVEAKVRTLVTGADGKRQIVERVYSRTFSDGNGNNQVGQVFYDESRALNNTSEDLDLSGSALKDFKGGNLDMTAVRVVWVENLDTDTGDTVAVSQPASNGVPNIFLAAGDGVKVHPGGLFLWVAPGPDDADITASTGDLLTVGTNDNMTYNVLVAGPNA